MKAFIFTLDAVFALIIAAAGTTILLYAHFTSPAALLNPSLEAYSIAHSLLSTSLAQACPNMYFFSASACNSIAGSSSFAFGSYNAPPTLSVLQAIADLYMDNNGPYGSLLLNAAYPSNNTAIFVNSVYGPSIGLQTANFNGASSYITASTQAVLPTQITIAAWINTNQNSNSWDAITNTGTTLFSATSTALYFWPDTNNYFAQYPYSFDSKWSFVAAEWDYNTEQGALYINGVKVSAIASPLPAERSFTSVTMGTYGSQYFRGSIANVQVYNSLLSAAQISQLYQQGLPLYERSNVTFG